MSIWRIWEAEPPELGPAKPYGCVEGWCSHEWTVAIEEGRLTFSCGCKLCDDGMADIEPEYLGGEFQARLILHRDPGQPYYGIDPEVWWEIVPVSPVEAKP